MSSTEFFGPKIDIGDCQPLRMGGSPTAGALIPNDIRSNVQINAITAPLVNFKAAHVGLAKSELPIKYLNDTPDSVPNSRKMPAPLIWLFTDRTSNDSKIIYLRYKGWYVYDKMWKPQGEEMIDFVVILQTEFLTCSQEERSIVAGRSIFKNITNGDASPRKKHIVDLEVDISSPTNANTIIFEMGTYFLRTRRMGENPYIMELQNATVDLRTNAIRRTSHTDYSSKQSLIRAPDYAHPVSSNSREPPTAEQDRMWVLDSIWSIFRPCASLQPHDSDARGILGTQDKSNSYFPPPSHDPRRRTH